MADIEELHIRMAAALDRIARGVETWDAGPPEPAEPAIDPAEVAALREALEDEKLANAQLEERIRLLKERVAKDDTAALKEQVAAARDASAVLEGEMARLREANETLLQTSESLRHANAQGVGEPDLINRAMQAELESLRALRAADAAEVAQLYATLAPILAEAGAPAPDALAATQEAP
ncbi:hypothetical protein [Cognatishimia sp. F0-27]|uniref:hypothetical protein n=1 Tax=Cognatishimia sp. F0-27 TaxID=2816855 RepID=UPI001D0C3E36|nr:hypothetical protein [Cognatishimia sp. F0-27]MCC1493332.1 hypothetical protein [Cognatishimia sp. F0-27]